MKIKEKSEQLWLCPKCGRQFERIGQTHSCKFFPLEKHFQGKPTGKKLYEKLKQELKSKLGPFRIESLECCIHFADTSTFAAVKIFKDKIKLDFSLSRKLKNNRICETVQMSAHRILYVIDVFNETEIDMELIKLIIEAYELKSKKAVPSQ